jgi:hypothetical protein
VQEMAAGSIKLMFICPFLVVMRRYIMRPSCRQMEKLMYIYKKKAAEDVELFHLTVSLSLSVSSG